MMKSYIALALFLVMAATAAAQEGKSWTDWSKKDVQKMLNDSAWGQTYTQLPPERTDTTVITNTRPGMVGSRSGESGEPPASKSIHYRARLLSARPVREAFSRFVLLAQPSAGADLKEQLQAFIDRDFGDFLVIAWSAESEDARAQKGFEAVLMRLNAEVLKDKVTLERKDGKSAALIDYKVPGSDGMGGKLVFSKTLDGQPFLAGGDETLKLNIQLNEKQKMTFRFKASAMNYNGKLEY